MLTEIAVVSGISAIGYTLLDFYNYLPWSKTVDGSFKLWWEKPPFVQPPAARATFARPTMVRPQISAQERIQSIQSQMGNLQRELSTANQQQMQETRYVQQSGKYTVSRW